METKNCKSCYYFEKVYRFGGYRFGYSTAYPKYYCALREQLTKGENICGNRRKRNSGYDISPQRFAEAEEDAKTLIALLSSYCE